MTNKLTGREALAYMATGGWFVLGASGHAVYRQKEDGEREYFDNGNTWASARCISALIEDGITPCPDPTVKIDEYEKKREGLLAMLDRHHLMGVSQLADHILDFVQDEFQRKEVKS